MKCLTLALLLCSALSMQHTHAMENLGLELGDDIQAYKSLEIAVQLNDGKDTHTDAIRRFYTLHGTRLYASSPQNAVTVTTQNRLFSAYVKLLEIGKNSVTLSYSLNFGSVGGELESVPKLELPLEKTHEMGPLETGYLHEDDIDIPIDLRLTIVAHQQTLQREIPAQTNNNADNK